MLELRPVCPCQFPSLNPLMTTACRLVFNVTILWGIFSLTSFLEFVIEVKSPDSYIVSVFDEGFVSIGPC